MPPSRPESIRLATATEVCDAAAGAGTLPSSSRPHDVALIQLTSGSTGHPRGVVVGHDELLLHMESMSRALPVARDGMTGVSWLPLHHDMGLIGGLLFPLYNGFPVHLLSPVEFRARPFAWLEALSEFKAGITPGPPSAYSLAVRLAPRAVEAKLDFSALECAMIGAEPISARFIRTFSEAFAPCGFRPEAFFPVYGLAEATVAVTFPPLLAPTRIDAVSRSGLERGGRALPSSHTDDLVEWVGVGTAIPNSEIKIVDDDNRVLPERHVGEIFVRSKTLFRGYFDALDETRDAIVDGWLRTGDLGYLFGDHLFVTGRRKDIIIKGGHNLSPTVIEELVSSVEGIRTGCVAAVGIYVSALETEEVWVVAETKLEAAAHRELSHRVRDALKLRGITVDQVRLVEPGTLPKTTSGKIQRTRVRDEVRSVRAAMRGTADVSEV
jgi:acyl-CoA synthetase (AMP-forming)/AMP-acid ligase II